MKTSNLLVSICSLLLASSMAYAQTDHSDHSQHQAQPTYVAPEQKGELAKLPEVPASGMARENGFDERSRMESISSSDALAQQCAMGTRGMLMLDNKTWEKCGGKPKGAAESPGKQDSGEHSQHKQ